MQSAPANHFLRVLFLFGFIASASGQTNISGSGLTEPERFHIAVEALSRLHGTDIEKNPEFKRAVEKILSATHGTPRFVQLVKQLQLKNQDEGLLEVAENFPASEAGVEAIRLIFENGNYGLMEISLRGTNSMKLVEALGNSGKKEALSLLIPLLTDSRRDLNLRKQAVRATAQTSDGANQLLTLAKEEKLPPDLKLIASAELNKARWENVKSEAEKILPLPQSHDSKPLPSLAELSKMKGDVANGEKVFFRTDTACGTCHQVRGRGGEIGPALSEIGTKLGKEALFESILEPSAGISVGYEANQVELKSGDEAYGLVVSETVDELVMKDLKGIVARYKKNEIEKRQQLKTSIMPAGLERTMSAQELVDLVEFLSTLRKTN